MSEPASWLERLLPRHLVETDGPWPAAPRQPQRHVRLAVALLVDVQGFTALTERYAQEGLSGVERLGVRLQALFEAIEHQVLFRGGDVQQFAGDALLGLWFADDPASLPALTRRALHAAQAMHDAAARQSLGHETALRLRIGVATGDVTLLLVGGEDGNWLHCAVGDSVAQALAASARRGESATWCAQQAFRDALGVPAAQSEGFVVVPPQATDTPIEPLSSPTPARLSRLPADLSNLVPGFVLERLEHPGARHTLELRQLSCAFVRLPFEHWAHEAWKEFHESIRTVQRAVRRHHGSIVRLGADGHGTMVLCVWGVPGHRHEDDAARALATAAEIADSLAVRGHRIPVGVGTGRGLAGFFGGSLRCEYTVHGQMINRAAKLAAAAAEGVVSDDATREQATRPHGRSPAVSATRSGGAAGIPTVAGRRDTRSRLGELILAASRHESRAILIQGPAGIGKSTLVVDALQRCSELGVRTWIGEAREPLSDSPYHVWRGLLPQLLDLPANASRDAVRDVALERSRTWGTSADWLPVLNDLTPLGLSETAATRGATDAGRADALRRLLRQMVVTDELVAGLLVFEDIHWSDAASWAMALSLFSTVPGLGLLATSRDEAGSPSRCHLPDDPRAEVLRLDPLSRHELDALVASALQVDEVEAALGRLLHDASGGHPMFGRDLALTLRDEGRLDCRGGLARLPPSSANLQPLVPPIVDALIMARIDRLPPQERRAVRLCSVLGDEFTEPLPPDLAAAIGTASGRLPAFTSALSLGLLKRVDGSDRLRFEHALVRDVVYESVPESARRQLHRSIARSLEKQQQADEGAAEIAHHWVRAGDVGPALAATLRAGESALRRYANRDAITWLEQAQSMLTAAGPGDRVLLARCLRLLGHARANLGEPVAATEALASSFVAPSAPWPRTAPAAWVGIAAQTARWMWRSRFTRAKQAPAGARRARSGNLLLGDAFAIVRLSESAYYNWDARSFLYAGLRGVNDAEASGDSADLALWHVGLVGIAGAMGFHSLAERYVERGLRLAHQLGDPDILARVHTFVAVGAAGLGHFDVAFDHLSQAVEHARRCSDSRRMQDALICEAVLRAQLGQDEPARLAYEVCRTASLERGDSQTLGWAYIGLAERHLTREEHATALGLLGKAAAHSTDRLSAINRLGHCALALSMSGQVVEATDQLRRCLVKSRGYPTSFSVFAGLRSAAQALVHLTRHSDARARPTATDVRTLRQRVALFARAFPIGAPLRDLLHGHLLLLTGKGGAATEQLDRAARVATSLSMLPEAQASWEAIVRCGTTQQRNQAREALRQLRAQPFAAGPSWQRADDPTSYP